MIYTNKLSNFRLQSHWIFLSYTVRAWFGTFEEDTDAKANKPQPILLNFFIGANILGFWSNFEEMWIWIRGTTWIINLFFHFKNLKKISESFKETGEERRIVNFNVPTWCSDLASVWLVASCRPRHHHCLSKELSSTLLLSPLLSRKYCR